MKRMKGFIIAGSILLGVGAISFVVLMSILSWDFNRLDTEVFTPAAYAVTEQEQPNIASVRVKVETGAVVIQRGEAIHVAYEENERVKTTVSVTGSQLTVVQTAKALPFRLFQFKHKIATVVTLPDGVFDLDIDSDNGMVTVEDGEFGKVIIESNNGKVLLKNGTCGEVELETRNGEIKAEGVQCDTLSANGRNGRVVLTKVAALEITFEAANGRLEFTDVTADVLTGSSGNGSAYLDTVTAGLVDIKCNNGRIEFEALESGDIKLVAHNGRIEGTVKGVSAEYRITAECRNERANVPGGSENGQYSLYAKSNNGRIEITFIG